MSISDGGIESSSHTVWNFSTHFEFQTKYTENLFNNSKDDFKNSRKEIPFMIN
jgi:hypothetical protein